MTAYDYTEINGSNAAISVEVPTIWTDIEDQDWILDGESVGRLLAASTSADEFRAGWTTPGVVIVASNILAARGRTLDSMFDDWSETCSGGQFVDYDDGLYEGRYRTWTDCGGADTTFYSLAAFGHGGSQLVFIQVQVRQQNIEAIERVFETFITTASLDGPPIATPTLAPQTSTPVPATPTSPRVPPTATPETPTPVVDGDIIGGDFCYTNDPCKVGLTTLAAGRDVTFWFKLSEPSTVWPVVIKVRASRSDVLGYPYYEEEYGILSVTLDEFPANAWIDFNLGKSPDFATFTVEVWSSIEGYDDYLLGDYSIEVTCSVDGFAPAIGLVPPEKC